MPSTAVQIVQSLYDAFARRDIARVFSLFSSEVELTQSTDIPWGGVYRGYDGAREFFGKLTQAITSTVKIERMIDAQEQVVVVGWTDGKVNATGVSYHVPIAHVWTVRAGLVVHAAFHIDNPTMLAALAAIPAAKSPP